MLAVAGCNNNSGGSLSTTPAGLPQTSSDFANIAGELSAPTNTDNGRTEAPVGGCANLTGPAVNAILTLVDCGSTLNTYRIVQRVNTPEECVADSDRTYYHNSKETGQFAACLDLAWDTAACINLGEPVSKVSCGDPTAHQKVKPLRVILNTPTLHGCSSGGYPHPVRRFAICTQEQP
ncbi:LppU/SCO3897 family protein [Mycobacteroides salmoniphilum]|uniref:LppU/SCO3897 family protein n=1 Tax=Mycobacteroides salmoniphilum TaxID=404941 RepID=UPI003B8A656A